MAKRRSYIRSKRGKAPDLGDISFRSSWERNFARILNIWVKEKEIDAWYFEPDEFEFSNIKRGTRYYLPDFKIIEPTGSHYYIEIKGWMDSKSKTKLKRFAKYYNHETLILVDKIEYKKYKKKYASRIAKWESDGV